MRLENARDMIPTNGTGMGGAGFPAHVKLSPSQEKKWQ